MESCLSLVDIDTCGSTNVTSAHTRRCITNSISGHFFFTFTRSAFCSQPRVGRSHSTSLWNAASLWRQGTVPDAGGWRRWLACSPQRVQAPGEHGKDRGTKGHHEFTLDLRSPACPSTEKYCREFAKCTKRCCFHCFQAKETEFEPPLKPLFFFFFTLSGATRTERAVNNVC